MERGERETCCDKQTRRGRKRVKIRKLPRFDPFRIFQRSQTSFWSLVAHFLVFGRKRNRSAHSRRRDAEGSEVAAVEMRPFPDERRGYFHAHWVTVKPREGGREGEGGREAVSSFWTTHHSSPSRLPFFPIAICPYFCPDHQKGYRRFGGLTP